MVRTHREIMHSPGAHGPLEYRAGKQSGISKAFELGQLGCWQISVDYDGGSLVLVRHVDVHGNHAGF